MKNRRDAPGKYLAGSGGISPHYELALPAWLALLAAVQGKPDRAYQLLRSPYAACLDAGFVRHVLFQREATLLADLPLIEHQPWPGVKPEDVTPIPTPCDLRVSPPGTDVDEMVKRATAGSKQWTGFLPPLEDAVRLHYSKTEPEQAILPLLLLIRVSPLALAHFVGPWEPHHARQRIGPSNPIARIEHVLFALIFDALYDLARTRSIPAPMVSGVRSSPPVAAGADAGSPLLEFTLTDSSRLLLSAGFTAPIFGMPGVHGFHRIMANPADGWARSQFFPAPPREDGEERPESDPLDEVPGQGGGDLGRKQTKPRKGSKEAKNTMPKGSGGRPANAPSTTGRPSGGGRGNNPSSK